MNRQRNDEIVHECQLDHPRDSVWHAITTPGLLAQWIGFSPGAVSDGGDTSGYRIVATRAPSRVELAWYDPKTGTPHSSVVIELEATAADRTLLRLVHYPVATLRQAANDPCQTTRALAA